MHLTIDDTYVRDFADKWFQDCVLRKIYKTDNEIIYIPIHMEDVLDIHPMRMTEKQVTTLFRRYNLERYVLQDLPLHQKRLLMLFYGLFSPQINVSKLECFLWYHRDELKHIATAHGFPSGETLKKKCPDVHISNIMVIAAILRTMGTSHSLRLTDEEERIVDILLEDRQPLDLAWIERYNRFLTDIHTQS